MIGKTFVAVFYLNLQLKRGCNIQKFLALGQSLLRKEVIHPHLPVRIPCYDLVLIADFTLIPYNGI